MDNETKPRPLPEKVVRRHADMLAELLPEITRLVIEEGRPADGLLSRHLRAHKELGSRDRRFLSQAVFSYFRWYGWTVNKLKLSGGDASLVGAALDSTDLGESFQYLENHSRLPFPVKPLGDKSLPEKAAILNKLLNDTEGFQPLELSDLVLPDFADMIDPEKALPCIEQFQKRPPTWIRSRTDPAQLVQALADARQRGVDVRVIIPMEGNHGIMNANNVTAANKLLKYGVRVFAYPGMSHVKAAVYDGWACLGSANFDKLSFRVNKEMNLGVSDPRFVDVLLEEVFEADFAASTELTAPLPEGWDNTFASIIASQL